MLFNNLEHQDFFGLKILKNGFNPDLVKNVGFGHDKFTQPVSQYFQDVIVLEQKSYNT